MKRFKVAAVQMECELGNPERNLRKAELYIRRAAGGGVKMVCLPELFDSGYDLRWIGKYAKHQCGMTKSFLSELASDLNIYIVAGLADVRRGKIFNSCHLITSHGRYAGHYDKNHLFPLTHEKKYFQAGKGVRVIKTPYCSVGMSLCFDLRFPRLFQQQAKKGAKIIVMSAAWGLKRMKDWHVFLKARALENQVYIVAAAQTGMPGKIAFAGNSAIVDFHGHVLAEKKKEEGVIVANVDMHELKKCRAAFPLR